MQILRDSGIIFSDFYNHCELFLPLQNLNRSCFFMTTSHYQNHQLSNNDRIVSPRLFDFHCNFRWNRTIPRLHKYAIISTEKKNPQVLATPLSMDKSKNESFFLRFCNVPRPVIIDDPCVSASGRQERPGTSLSTNFAPETVTAHLRRH